MEDDATQEMIQEQLDKLLSVVEFHVEKRTFTLKEKHAKIQEDLNKLRKESLQFEEEKKRFEEEVEMTKKQLEEERKRMESVHQFQSSKVKLDVGGFHFTTSRSTLTKFPNTMLGSMFSGRFSLKCDEDGSYFIDRLVIDHFGSYLQGMAPILDISLIFCEMEPFNYQVSRKKYRNWYKRHNTTE